MRGIRFGSASYTDVVERLLDALHIWHRVIGATSTARRVAFLVEDLVCDEFPEIRNPAHTVRFRPLKHPCPCNPAALYRLCFFESRHDDTPPFGMVSKERDCAYVCCRLHCLYILAHNTAPTCDK